MLCVEQVCPMQSTHFTSVNISVQLLQHGPGHRLIEQGILPLQFLKHANRYSACPVTPMAVQGRCCPSLRLWSPAVVSLLVFELGCLSRRPTMRVPAEVSKSTAATSHSRRFPLLQASTSRAWYALPLPCAVTALIGGFICYGLTLPIVLTKVCLSLFL